MPIHAPFIATLMLLAGSSNPCAEDVRLATSARDHHRVERRATECLKRPDLGQQERGELLLLRGRARYHLAEKSQAARYLSCAKSDLEEARRLGAGKSVDPVLNSVAGALSALPKQAPI